MFPGHPVWHHAVFQHPAYTAFARKVEACMLAEEQEGPSQLSLLYQAMPLLVDHLKAMDARSEQRASELQALLNRVAESQQTQSTQLQFLMSGSLTFRLEAPRLAAAPAAAAAAALLAPVVTSTMASSRYASAQASVASTPPRLASHHHHHQGRRRRRCRYLSQTMMSRLMQSRRDHPYIACAAQ